VVFLVFSLASKATFDLLYQETTSEDGMVHKPWLHDVISRCREFREDNTTRIVLVGNMVDLHPSKATMVSALLASSAGLAAAACACFADAGPVRGPGRRVEDADRPQRGGSGSCQRRRGCSYTRCKPVHAYAGVWLVWCS
jgi:hypothetical protein